MDYSDAHDNDLLCTPLVGHLDLPGVGVAPMNHSGMPLELELPPVGSSGVKVPFSRQPSVLGPSIAGGLGVPETIPTGDPSVPMASAARGLELPLVPSTKGKEIFVAPVDEPAL